MQTVKSKKMKQAKFWLQLWDGLWSIPLSLIMIIGFGMGVQYLFTDPSDMGQGGPGFWDLSMLQAIFYAGSIVIACNFVVWMGIYYNFRGLFRYLKGQKEESGTVFNQSKVDFLNLSEWQKISITLFVYCFLSVEFFVAFLLIR